jgi:hypothetical protein
LIYEANNKIYDTAEGYCIKKGFKDYEEVSLNNDPALNPLVIIDQDGNILKTLKVNNGQMWTIDEILCSK